MAWNWLDILIVVLAVAQIGVVVAIGVVVGRIRRGGVARVAGSVSKIVQSGTALVETGKSAGIRSLPHLQAMRVSLAKMPRSFKPVVLDDAPVSYQSLAGHAGAARLLLGMRRGTKPGAARVARTGLAERAGLIPPAWRKIAPLLGYARIGLDVWREVQAQLPRLRQAASERARPVDSNPSNAL